MYRIIKVALAVYIVVMLVCAVVFFMQKSVIYSEHINPAQEKMLTSMGENADAEKAIEYNRSLAETSIRMGNEIQEHLFILLLANLATGIFLVVCVLYFMNDHMWFERTS